MISIHRANRNENRIIIHLLSVATLCLLAPFALAVAAEEGEIPSEFATPEDVADEAALAKTIQNPLATLITLPFQANYNNGVGPDDRTFYNLNIQPVIPFPGDAWNVITRTIIPYNTVPIGTTDSVTGFGDVHISIFWSPNKKRSFTWGVGPAATLPTASNPEVLGSDKLSIGPTGVIFYGINKWTLGIVGSNVWSVAGDSTRQDVNFFFAQWFANYNFGKGWALGTAPIITCDWEAASGEECTIPWGLQLSKVTHIGRIPINLLGGYYKNSTHPTDGAEEQVRIQINFLFPQKH